MRQNDADHVVLAHTKSSQNHGFEFALKRAQANT